MNTILRAAAAAFQTRRAVVAATIAIVLLWTIASWLSNLDLLSHTLGNPKFDGSAFLAFFVYGLAIPVLNSPPLTLVFLIVAVALTGWQAGLLAYAVGKRFHLLRSTGSSALGAAVALLGVGCSACGSVILTSLLGVGATAGLVAVLPLGGAEFPLLASLILAATITHTSRRLLAPEICPVP